ncbi:hypothetical protein SOVF_203470, partial [Spinacia oleracea]
YLILNKFGQPVGPDDETVEEFTRFLGTVAKNSELAPLNFINWPSLPTHDNIWEYVQEKYLVPEEGRKWVQMEALLSQEHEEGQKNADPYYEVIKKAEHNGRVRLFGKVVTKSDLKNRGKASGYTIPEEFLQSIQAMLIKQFQEANPGMNLVVPGSSTGSIPRESTSDRSHVNEERSGEQSSVGTQLENQ